jgi:hypothetical protein
MIMKNKKNQNAVKTTTEMNIAAAVLNDTLRDAEVHLRALQHANDRGTTASLYAELERRWEIKQQTPFGQWLEKTAADQS